MGRTFRVLASALSCLWLLGVTSTRLAGIGPTEAPAGFDNRTNGLVAQALYDADRTTFEERDEISGGLGPLYNAQSCAECHQTPITGGGSQIAELRAGTSADGVFTPHPGGSLINDRATDASIQEHVYDTDNVQTLRMTLNTLGDGFVEAIADATFTQIRNAQPPHMRGQIIMVPIAEAGGALRIGRFGWKNQNASLLSFSADAYLNEQGITNRLFSTENTSSGYPVDQYDPIKEVNGANEDPDNDIDAFAEFMRATKAPPRGPRSATANAGETVFNAIGCNICHTAAMTTAPAGTSINGGALNVPNALGDKIIHPFSDYMLHDIGTGDGIVQNGGPSTRNKLRTAPLWGLRTRSRLMHDGKALTYERAIQRHKGQAEEVSEAFKHLSPIHRAQLSAFLASL